MNIVIGGAGDFGREAAAAFSERGHGVTVIDILGNGDNFGSNGACGLSFTQPFNGTTSLDDGGTPTDPRDDMILYEPEEGYEGSDSFEYTIADCSGASDTANVTLDVHCTCDSVSSDSAGLSKMAMIVMMLLSIVFGLLYIKKEELREEEK